MNTNELVRSLGEEIARAEKLQDASSCREMIHLYLGMRMAYETMLDEVQNEIAEAQRDTILAGGAA